MNLCDRFIIKQGGGLLMFLLENNLQTRDNRLLFFVIRIFTFLRLEPSKRDR